MTDNKHIRIGNIVRPCVEGTEIHGRRGRVVSIIDKDKDGNPCQSSMYPKYQVDIDLRGSFSMFFWEIVRA